MKHLKHLFTALLLLCSVAANAHDFEVAGIYYNITDETNKTVEVTYRGSLSGDYSNEYTGDVTIPETVTYNYVTYSVTSIGNYAFYDCSGLTSVVIGNSVTSIGSTAFSGTAWYNNQPNGLIYAGKVLYKYKGTMPDNTSITIKDGTLGIADGAFSGCSGLTSIEIPNSVTSIGDYAFEGCSEIKRFTIPNSVTSIGRSAFSGTVWYNNQPNGLIYAGKVLYTYKGTMPDNTSITIKDGTLGIAGGAFYDCDGLTSIEIPNSVTSIGNEVFYDCDGLTSVTIPNSVTSIGEGAFYDCDGLTSITIPNSVTSIGNQAFNNCSRLTSIEIPNSVTSIGNGAFWYCEGLKTVINFSNLTFEKGSSDNGDIAHYADKVINAPGGEMTGDFCFFTADGKNYLAGYIGGDTEITLPASYKGESYEIAANAFKQNSSITNVNFTNGVTCIGENAFSGCTALEKIELPNSVTSIGNLAFYSCYGLRKVVVPENITYIGESAFENCTALAEIRSFIPAVRLFVPGDYAFEGVDKDACILYVPQDAKKAYATTAGWSDFANIIDGGNMFTVTYIVDGEGYATDSVAYGDEVVLIDEPVREGYTFSGWSEVPAKMPAEDITVTGTFAVNSYAVTYMLDGNVYEAFTVEYGAEIPAVDTPVREGYTFSGWSEIPERMPANNITIEGKFTVKSYTITYVVDGEVYATDSIAYGDEVVLIDEPVREGHTFSGWSEVPATMPAEDITITGSFTVNSYTVTYMLDGEVYEMFTVEYGAEIPAVDTPVREGYTFSGWSEIPATMPAEDITVEGSFAVNTYVVTYIVDGEVYATDSVAYGDEVVLIDEPVREGHTFSGWSEVPATMPAEDITITGSFAVNSYTVTYIVDGEVYATDSVAYGDEVVLIDEPVREGYTFSGWSEVPATMPAGDITVTGAFTKTDTGIEQVMVDGGEIVIYDLNGMRIIDVQELKRGVYIVNGKKVLVK